MRKSVLALAATMLLGASSAQSQPQSPPPKLMVVIAVDQFSANLFDEYRGQFTGGLARLAAGTVHRNGYQSHATTETCPGHATIITGTHPGRSGIVSNSWPDFAATRTDKNIYCTEDERVAGSDSDHYTLSSVHLKTQAIGDILKAQSPASRVVAVAGKDRSAALFGGHRPDGVFYWNGKAFTSEVDGSAPAALTTVNHAVAGRMAEAQEAMTPPPFCAARAKPIAVPEHAPVGTGAFARAAGNAGAWRASPEADEATLALSAALVREMALGKGPQTDLLAVSLSATDYVGHAYGTEGEEMCLQLLSLDQSLGDFFDRLDSWGVDYAVALSADHGGADIPERARLNGHPNAERIDPDLTPAKISEKVRAATGISGPVLADIGVIGDLYLDPSLKGAVRAKALAAAATEYRRHPQVEAVFTGTEIEKVAMPSGDPTRWSLIQRVRASYDTQRSGDLYVVLKPEITPIGHATGSVATHGSPWDYDRRVPIIFWRKGAPAQAIDGPADVVDIAPTIAAMIGLSAPPATFDGHCISAPGVACPTQ